MQRIGIGIEAIEQRGLRHDRQAANRIRRACRRCRQRFGRGVALAKAAVAAAEGGVVHGGQFGAAGHVHQRALDDHQRAFAGALVDHVAHAGAGAHGAGCRQRAMQAQALLTVHDAHPVDAAPRVLHPEAGIGQHHGLRGKGLELRLVDVAQLARIGGLLAQAKTQRVEDGILLGVGLRDLRKVPVLDAVVVERHGVRSGPS